MRILMISTYFRPDVAANGVIMAQIAENLVQLGHHVRVLTTMPHYAGAGNGDAPRRGDWHGADVSRLRVYTESDRSDMKQRMLNYFTYNAQASLHGVAAGSYDVALIPSPPLTNGLVGDLLLRLRGIPFVYNVQDIWPDVLFRAGMNPNSRFADFLRWMERYIYRRAAAVSVISEGFRRNLEARNVPREKIAVIPNFCDTDFIAPRPRNNAFSAEHQLDDRFVIMFAGNIGHSQGLDTILDAAQQLRVSRPKALFLLVGDGASRAGLAARAAELQLDNVRFLPFQPHEAIPDLYASADLCLVPLKHGFTNESVPSKMFTIMASGTPLIAGVDENSDTGDLVRAARCGTIVPPESAAMLANEIERLMDHPVELRAAGAAGRAYVTQHFAHHAVAAQYEELLWRVSRRSALRQTVRSTPLESRIG